MPKKILQAIALCTLLVPLQALSMGTLDAHDTIAGMGETVQVSGLDGNATTLFVISPRGKELDLPAAPDMNGQALVHVPEDFTQVAGTYRLFLGTDQTKLGTEGSFTVLPEQIDAHVSTVQTDTLLIKPNGSDEAVVTVTLKDKFGNPLPGRPVKLNARPQDTVTPLSNQTDAQGQQKFSVRTRTAGTIGVHAIDQLTTTLLDASAQIDAGTNGGAQGNDSAPVAHTDSLLADLLPSTTQTLDHFQIDLDPVSPKQKDFVKLITITAEDAQGNVVTTYDRQVDIYVSTDPSAVLPAAFATPDNPNPHGKVTFDPKRKGVANIQWGLSFSQAGQQTVVVDDGKGVHSEKTVTVIPAEVAGPTRLITVSAPAEGAKVKGNQVVIQGSASPDINFHVDGTGITPAPEGKTGDDGSFSVTVPLDAGASDYALQLVNDENAGEKSDTLHLVRDTTPPSIDVTLSPANPGQGDQVTAEVKSDPGLASVTLSVDDQQYSLTEATDAPGTYRVMFPAPNPGTHPVHATVSDSAGNTATKDTSLTVGLPPVKNLKVTSTKPYEADLAWDTYNNWNPADPTGSAVVYVGTGSSNFTRSFDTHSQANSAAVTGLKPGQTYYFMVTVKQSGQESKPGDTVSAQVHGTNLTVTPKDTELTLAWSFEDSIPLKGFLLEFNTDPLDPNPDNNQTRMIDNGATKFYDLRDLINGVTYHLRLTPIDVTGKTLDNYAITADAMPNGDVAFHPGASISIASTGAFSNALHGSAPSTPGSGLPPFALWLILGTSMLGFLLYWKHRASRRQTQMFLQSMNNRYHDHL